MKKNSIDLIHTSIPFSNHYEYSANYNDFGHNATTAKFFEQMDFLTPELFSHAPHGACELKCRLNNIVFVFAVTLPTERVS